MIGADDCPRAISYVLFEMPQGVIAISPANNSLYDYPGNNNLYNVENPANTQGNSGFHGIKFETIGEGIKTGMETFVYVLPGEPMESVMVQVKAGGKKVNIDLDVEGCSCSDGLGLLAMVPDENIDLTATATAEHIRLTLGTNTTSKNGYYVIERSMDGQHFEPILVQNVANDGNPVLVYNELDETPLIGDNYYRVKLFFDNGSFTYSNIDIVHFARQGSFSLYPNTVSANGQVYLHLDQLPTAKVQIEIFDQFGRLMNQINETSMESQKILLDLDGLQNGIYLVNVRIGGFKSTTEKLILLH